MNEQTPADLNTSLPAELGGFSDAELVQMPMALRIYQDRKASF